MPVAPPSPAVLADDLLTVHEAHTRGLPPLRPYGRELMRRRRFAVHMARADLKAKHYDTVFGQLWRILNPLLLALIYYFVLGVILDTQKGSGDYFARLLGGLFAFYYTSNAVNFGAKSIVGGGGLIMNTAFPRALLPISAVISSLLTYLPMLAVYALFHLLRGLPIEWPLLLVPLIILIQTVFNLGLALILSAATVYFRDTASFLPYMLRVWLYLTPILWVIDDVPHRLRPLLGFNPLVPILTAWHDILVEGTSPGLGVLVWASAWAVAAALGGAWFFLSREREFAVRI